MILELPSAWSEPEVPRDLHSPHDPQALASRYEDDQQTCWMGNGRGGSPSYTRPISHSLLSTLLITVLGISLLIPQTGAVPSRLHDATRAPVDHLVVRQASSATELLRNFEVTAPVYIPPKSTCVHILMTHSFGNSYGAPYVGKYFVALKMCCAIILCSIVTRPYITDALTLRFNVRHVQSTIVRFQSCCV